MVGQPIVKFAKTSRAAALLAPLVPTALLCNYQLSLYFFSGRQIRRQYWWQNTKMKIAVVFGIILGIYIIVSISCGGLDWNKCV